MSFKGALTRPTLLLLTTLSLVISLTAGAQANWLVLHNFTTVEPDVTLAASAHTETNFLVSNFMQILCAIVEPDPGAPILLLQKSTVGHGHLLYRKCKTWIMLKEAPACPPIEPILLGGLELLILHNSRNYILVEGLPEQPVGIIFFNPATCALPEEIEITGSLVWECGHLQPANTFVGLDCKNHQVTQLVRQAPGALFPSDKLFFGLWETTVDGITAFEINSPALYVGRSWGGHI